MTSPHQDAADLVVRLEEERKLCAIMGDTTAHSFLGEISNLIEQQAKALSEAEEKATVSFRCGVAHQNRARELEAEIHASFGKWSKELGWGLTAFQPECWAMMDMAVSELVRARARLAEAMKVIEPFANLVTRYDDMISDGWIPWVEFLNEEAWPSEEECAAARSFLNSAPDKEPR